LLAKKLKAIVNKYQKRIEAKAEAGRNWEDAEEKSQEKLGDKANEGEELDGQFHMLTTKVDSTEKGTNEPKEHMEKKVKKNQHQVKVSLEENPQMSYDNNAEVNKKSVQRQLGTKYKMIKILIPYI